MADFAKSILGLRGFYRKDGSNGIRPEADQENQPIAEGEQQHIVENQSKFWPKGLSNAAPATAVSNNSLVYGTTTNLNTGVSETYLNQAFRTNGLNSDLSASSQYGQHERQQHNQNYEELNEAYDSIDNPKRAEHFTQGQPLIITTDENGNTLRHLKDSQPKGKLKVTIVEAKDLPASQPYVVCTFESSEFVTAAPGSFGKSPLHNHDFSRAAVPMRNHPSAMYQRQSSSHQLNMAGSTNPIWNHEAMFDVVGSKSELDISVYDAARDDEFLGHLKVFPPTNADKNSSSEWWKLKPRIIGERVQGSIKIKWEYSSLEKKSFGPDDFDILRLLGKGTFGQVYQVKKKDTERIYAMKVLSKKVIIKKKEIAHTIGERNILVRTSAAASPFIVGLKFSFQTPTDLYLVTDYMSGGELFWHLQKEGRFAEDRAKFYIAELVLALQRLHDNDIVYRDLKPENILLDANGHIALCDFGLSKANLNNDGTTNTFCGTTEYLAPEVLLDESGYTKMVDFWSLGVLIFEMCCGWSPFYADNTQQMYKNIAFGKVRFPKEVLSPEGRSFVKGLLNRNPKHRLGATNDAAELKAHPFFHDIDWNLLREKNIPPPFKPHLSSETDTSNFDPEFTSESTSVLRKQMEFASTPLSPGMQANFKGFTYVDDSTMEDQFDKFHRMNTFKGPGSFIPGDPNLPPDEDVIDDDQIDEKDEMEIDEDHHMDDEEFVNGRFDL
ncbi:uncharacterized protein PRCAT00003852001 [Priceomyces carsonii]|uniref:uncharacterized protein n=1 Tax=Priceomyces carsonii TaxID=28549 RepID=UPI002ED98EEB|nr:unnamed protein product [Priceomyces carsonii]